MLFNSYEFLLLFLPVTVVAVVIGRRFGGLYLGMCVLVAASLIFYGWNKPWLVLLLGGSITVNFGLGLALAARRARSIGGPLLALGVIANLALLGYFKYLAFFTDTLATIFGAGWQVEAVALPLAISFFTFQQIAYLADVKGGTPAERNPVRYTLFVAFFPQLVAGPIVHHGEMLPQFADPNRFAVRIDGIAIGGAYFLIGLFKKVVLADQLETYATPTFNAALAPDTTIMFAEAWLASLAFSFQIYFDFSGYSDMAVGLARMFGIRLPFNFNSPYQATDISKFWRAWHMTLSRFLRDYLYIPLGGNRRGHSRRYVNLMTVMLLGGLWHGAGWTFVIWGGLHGIALIAHRVWRKIAGAQERRGPIRYLAIAITFLFVTLAWVFFRAETPDAALRVIEGLFGVNGITVPDVLRAPFALLGMGGLDVPFVAVENFSPRGVVLCALAAVIAFFLPNSQTILEPRRAARQSASSLGVARSHLRPTAGWAVFVGVLGALGVAGLGSTFTFLYFEF